MHFQAHLQAIRRISCVLRTKFSQFRTFLLLYRLIQQLYGQFLLFLAIFQSKAHLKVAKSHFYPILWPKWGKYSHLWLYLGAGARFSTKVGPLVRPLRYSLRIASYSARPFGPSARVRAPKPAPVRAPPRHVSKRRAFILYEIQDKPFIN